MQAESPAGLVDERMVREYVHFELGAEVRSIGGYYTIDKEVRVPHNGREALVAFGFGVADTSCCGAGTGCRFANVVGYVLAWKTGEGPDGLPISQVEPIRDESARCAIRKLIASSEPHCQVNFL
jgi:hypothetical protein